jgi:hypothetical protein
MPIEAPLSLASAPPTRLPPVKAPPSKAPTDRTSEWHMLAHETAVPEVQPLPAALHRITLRSDGAQHNPSLCMVNGELRAVVRVLHGIKTTNYVGRITSDWQLTDTRLMICHEAVGHKGQIEDLRLFMWQGRPWAIAAAHPGVVPATNIRQALLELSDDGAVILKTHVQPAGRNEKNWMPAVSDRDDTLKFIYSTHPLIVFNVDKIGRASPGATSVAQVTGHIRGGSQLVPWGTDEWLSIVHQVHRPKRMAEGQNPLLSSFWPAIVVDPVAGTAPVVYLHRFAIFDKALSGVRLSKPFYFIRLGVEFCCGLVRFQDRYVASFGVADNEAWLAEITDETVRTLF